jgi:hypothetical protein
VPDEWIRQQAQLCDNVAMLNRKYAPEVIGATPGVDADGIVAALHQFAECVRYLNTRRSAGAVLNLNNENDVQDAVYLMLRPWVHDLRSENPTDRIANRYTIKDFISFAAETVIEVKYVRDAHHGRQISSEMHDDIETYRHHPKCRTLVFFVYDPEVLIPDQESLRAQIEEPRLYGNRPLRCVLIVKP